MYTPRWNNSFFLNRRTRDRREETKSEIALCLEVTGAIGNRQS